MDRFWGKAEGQKMQQIELFQQALWAYVMHICAFLQFCLIFIKAFISLLPIESAKEWKKILYKNGLRLGSFSGL